MGRFISLMPFPYAASRNDDDDVDYDERQK